MEIKYDKLKCKDCKHKDYCKYTAEAQKVIKYIETEIPPRPELDSFLDIEYKCKFFEDKFAIASHVYLNTNPCTYPNMPTYDSPADPLDPWQITCSDLSSDFQKLEKGLNQLKNKSN